MHDKDFQFSQAGIFILFLINYPEMKSLSKLSLTPKIFTSFKLVSKNHALHSSTHTQPLRSLVIRSCLKKLY